MTLLLQILGILAILIIIGYGITTTIIIKRLFSKMELYELYFVEVQDQLVDTIQIMKKIDMSGVFEADDQVGETFTRLRKLVDNLDEILSPPKKASLVKKLLEDTPNEK